MTTLTAPDELAFSSGCCPLPSGTTGETTVLSQKDLFLGPMFALCETPPTWLPGVITKLSDLAPLEDNWDSYGASPIDPRSISNAQALVQWLAMFIGVDEPAVGASPDGEAGLSWDGGPWSLDVDVSPDGRIDYVYIDDRDAARDVEASTHDPYELLTLLTAWD
ncbi:MAG: hypothetical protein WBE26_13850 [Phycisphaerae bacterium]